jgi:hypothetical protein
MNEFLGRGAHSGSPSFPEVSSIGAEEELESGEDISPKVALLLLVDINCSTTSPFLLDAVQPRTRGTMMSAENNIVKVQKRASAFLSPNFALIPDIM